MAGHLERLKSALADRYAIEREVGAGGMATVYLAEDLKLERKVAIKVLHPELAAVLGPERFLREIKLTVQLQHPHILPLHDSGETGGLLYYVMPHVEGESLRDRLNREKHLPVEDALQIACEVASALDYAHRHDVIHRDIKPENIWLHDGQALVADFGIALAVHAAGGTGITETGLSLGTPQYMSPEQATGDREIDARTDIYSLAAVLYEMLSGEPPHTGATAQIVIAKVETDHPRPITEIRDTIPAHVERALGMALAKLPADRYGSAHAFGESISGRGSAGAGHAVGPRREAARKLRRQRLIGWGIAASIGLTIGIAVGRLSESGGPMAPGRIPSTNPGAIPMNEQQPIGQATMEDDGTIVLDLFPSGEQGEVGIAQFRISPTDAEYQSTLEHVGGLQPGEQKLVPPWPEEEG